MNLTTYKISMSGLNLHHALTYFQDNKIYLSELERLDKKKIVFNISSNDYLKFKKSKIYKKYKVKIIKRYGLSGFFRCMLEKIGLTVGIMIIALTTINLTNHVHKVEINTKNHSCQNGDSCIFNETNIANLYSKLESLGIKKNQKISKLPSNKDVKIELMSTFPQISEVYIQTKGVVVDVNILEAKLPTNSVKNNLVASENGIVIRLNVTSGKAKVKIGDVVLKGQTLIENTGTPVCGEVAIRAFYHQNTIFNENQITYQRTGRKKQVNSLSLFGINLKSNKKCNFNIYETQETNKYISLNSLLPIKLNQVTFYELEKKENHLSFDSQRDLIYKELEAKTKLLVPSNAEIKNTTFTTKQEGSRHLVTCYIETYLTLKI